jgi:hypothetical protein
MHHQSIISTNNNNNNNTNPSLSMKLNSHQHTQHTNRISSHSHGQMLPSTNSLQKSNTLLSKKHHHHHHHNHHISNRDDHNQEQIKFFTQKNKKHKSKRLKSTLQQTNSSNVDLLNTFGHKHTSKNMFSNFFNKKNEDFSEQQKYFKLPILTSIELVNNNETKVSSNDSISGCNKDNLLFKDYVLIPSMTKYKHLLHTVFQEAQLENKSNYNIAEGNNF